MDFQYIALLLPQLAEGLLVTVKLFAITIVISIPLGLIVSLGRVSKFRPLQWIISAYLWVFRGTPLMLQLFFVYFGLPSIYIAGASISFEAFPAAVIAFVLNYAAYFAEIFRGGILSVNKGQYEASKALGFTSWQTMRYIVVPQMIRTVIPPVANETITLVKDTALASVISIIDLLKKAQEAVARDANVTAYLVVAVFFLAITFVLTMLFHYVERRFAITAQEGQ
jgi:polar amino acid transport system permease protein